MKNANDSKIDMTDEELKQLLAAPRKRVEIVVEPKDLHKCGPVIITEIGEENIYFITRDGRHGCCKCL